MNKNDNRVEIYTEDELQTKRKEIDAEILDINYKKQFKSNSKKVCSEAELKIQEIESEILDLKYKKQFYIDQEQEDRSVYAKSLEWMKDHTFTFQEQNLGLLGKRYYLKFNINDSKLSKSLNALAYKAGDNNFILERISEESGAFATNDLKLMYEFIAKHQPKIVKNNDFSKNADYLYKIAIYMNNQTNMDLEYDWAEVVEE